METFVGITVCGQRAEWQKFFLPWKILREASQKSPRCGVSFLHHFYRAPLLGIHQNIIVYFLFYVIFSQKKSSLNFHAEYAEVYLIFFVVLLNIPFSQIARQRRMEEERLKQAEFVPAPPIGQPPRTDTLEPLHVDNVHY